MGSLSRQTLSTFALLLSATMAATAATDQPFEGVVSIGGTSTGKLDIGLLGVYQQFGNDEPRASGFYSKGKIAHFVIPTDGGGVSYDALLPGIVIHGALIVAYNEYKGNAWARGAAQIVSLLNGEVGYRHGYFSLGVVNGFHPFFTRRVYHDAGVRLGIGKAAEWGLTTFEEDRLQRGTVRYGVKMDFQGYWGW